MTPVTDTIRPFYDEIVKAFEERDEDKIRIWITTTYWCGYNRREEEYLEEQKQIPDTIILN